MHSLRSIAPALLAVALLHGCSSGSAPGTVDPDNAPPVAALEVADDSVVVGTTVSLDGSDSSDAEGDSFEYVWTIESRPAGSTAVLQSIAGNSTQRELVPDLAGTYVVRLTLEDVAHQTDSATVTITAQAPPPVANAGLDRGVQFAEPSTVVNLDGSGSTDPSSLPLTYAWSQVSFVPAGAPPATPVTLVNPTTATPSFTVTDPDQLGVYTFSLTVDNGTSTSTDQVVITVGIIPPPVANAGADQEVTFVVDGVTVNLDGSGSSDPSDLPLTYAWQILSFAPESGDPPAVPAALVNANTATPSFDITAIDQLGTYTLQLTVDNGTLPDNDLVVVAVAKTFPAAGALLGSGLLGAAAFAARRWRRRGQVAAAARD
jgi:hypothetical protein